MSLVRVQNLSISLDGFGTGEGQSLETPMGHAGQRLHSWMFDTAWMGGTNHGVDNTFASMFDVGVGAEIMGRKKFWHGTGPWTDLGTDDEWRGWWGANPPFRTPVFVLTHYPRPSIEMEGGTTFHFIDASPAEAIKIARESANGLDIRIGGGPSTVREFLAAALIDVAHIVVSPIVLGRGERLWDGLEGLEETYSTETVSSPSGVTHLTLTRKPTDA